ncbi:SGNH/GDSL hydrolase family protein [Puia sp. P3]|uniref:SGNH/GDSL hydrolase family protein n=1 Tax=Puia sp. P3 TaxID=3423952 RepID=UPI003D66FE34
MRHLLILLCWVLPVAPAYSQHKIFAGMGSSTMAGVGSTPTTPPGSSQPPVNAWASILTRYYQATGYIDSLYNLGRPGTTTYSGLPTSYTIPDGLEHNPDYDVDGALNSRFAFGRPTDIVIVNYANNDVGNGYTLAQSMENLQIIYNTVIAAGKIAFITTTQPRTGYTTAQKQLLKVERDSIMNRFGVYAINFYNPIVAADSLNINPIYSAGDNIHVNNAGHQVLFEAARDVMNNVLFGAPLPITLTAFNAVKQQQKVVLSWTGMDQTGAPVFIVQRSGDGSSFDDIASVPAVGAATAHNYTWSDAQPLAGKSFYRIKVTEHGETDHYSVIATVMNIATNWKIGKLYRATGSTWNIEILAEKNTRLQLRVVDANGKSLMQRAVSVTSSSRADPPESVGPVRWSVLRAAGVR